MEVRVSLLRFSSLMDRRHSVFAVFSRVITSMKVSVERGKRYTLKREHKPFPSIALIIKTRMIPTFFAVN